MGTRGKTPTAVPSGRNTPIKKTRAGVAKVLKKAAKVVKPGGVPLPPAPKKGTFFVGTPAAFLGSARATSEAMKAAKGVAAKSPAKPAAAVKKVSNLAKKASKGAKQL
jgi:hypothetical protein